jgi:hypothetical protein
MQNGKITLTEQARTFKLVQGVPTINGVRERVLILTEQESIDLRDALLERFPLTPQTPTVVEYYYTVSQERLEMLRRTLVSPEKARLRFLVPMGPVISEPDEAVSVWRVNLPRTFLDRPFLYRLPNRRGWVFRSDGNLDPTRIFTGAPLDWLTVVSILRQRYNRAHPESRSTDTVTLEEVVTES